ncbi:uncharacterized protein I303_100175 [Kwoniella dejecticola CBS 10117]|uniref:Uncharacterized protein n=1 Tax=Kwoniella dejecticola CBS 10117 TaxID=1296121 RepID=A0A1A6AEB1_9TREE|nr:uncharacterized protein I303_00177 [Kwoniella dejecticola CBS 10117]OBR88363.1 hypothetical protein I303_00177 [Kwoniella dejecticola CBS 10117]
MSSLPGVVILLNGYPGVGKSSVAKELLKILPNARLLEYHSLRAVIDPLIDRERDTDRWMEMKKALLQTLLHNLSTNPPSPNPPIYILTSHLCATPRRLSVLHSHLSEELPLIHILMNCSTEENLRRLKSSSRMRTALSESNINTSANSTPNSQAQVQVQAQAHIHAQPQNGMHGTGTGTGGVGGGTRKITDESTLYELRMEEELGRFYASGGLKSTGRNGDSIQALKERGLLGEYEVNTDNMQVEQTAMLISEYVIEGLREKGAWIRLIPQRW